ncbi:MAG: transporter substrate-binding domain-containing protein [Thermoanaerobaculia bacterium]|nr:transporter substrate-binding domain-containing protein [Thermoanaerobaculia bacterium]
MAIRRSTALIVLTSLLALVTATSGSAQSASPPVLTVQDAVWPPYYFGDSETHKGFAKEVLERCLPTGEIPFQFYSFPIVRMFNYLRSGEIDVHVVSKSAEREDFLWYGQEPLFVSSYRPIVRSENTMEVHSLADLDGHRLGAIRGVGYVEWFQSYLDQRDRAGTLEWAPDNESILRMLLANRIDVFINTVSTSKWLAQELDAADQIRILDFDVKTSPYYVVVSRASKAIPEPAAFLAKVDACIRKLKTEPIYRQLEEQYHLN